MTYRLFIDDVRDPPNDGGEWIIARSTHDAKVVIHKHGIPSFISFDHDLGGNDTSMEFIKWLIDAYICAPLLNDCVRKYKFPEYTVHSQNPVGAENIRGLMDAFTRHWNDHADD